MSLKSEEKVVLLLIGENILTSNEIEYSTEYTRAELRLVLFRLKEMGFITTNGFILNPGWSTTKKGKNIISLIKNLKKIDIINENIKKMKGRK